MTDERERIEGKDVFWLFAYSVLIGALLAVFSSLQSFWKFLFSLGALFVGFRFFGRYERFAMRVWLVVLSLFFFFLFTVVLALILYFSGRVTMPE